MAARCHELVTHTEIWPACECTPPRSRRLLRSRREALRGEGWELSGGGAPLSHLGVSGAESPGARELYDDEKFDRALRSEFISDD